MVTAPPAITFFVTGKPQTKGSLHFWHRFNPNGRCQTGTSEEGGPALKEWRALIATAAKRAMRHEMPLDGPVKVGLTFLFERPKSNHDATGYAWGNHRWDLDKLCRAALDAVTDAACWKDDSQVAVLVAEKRYADGFEKAGVLVTLEALP